MSLSLSRSPYLCLWSPFSFLSRISEINVAGWSQSNIWILEGMLGLNGHGTESYIAAFNLGFSTFPIFKHCFFSVTLLSSKNTMSGKWWSTMSVNFSKPCRLDSEYQRLTNSSVYHELKEQAEQIRTKTAARFLYFFICALSKNASWYLFIQQSVLICHVLIVRQQRCDEHY